MSDSIAPFAGLMRPERRPLQQNAAAVYIGTLTSARSRQVMLDSLDLIAGMLTGRDKFDSLRIEWGLLRYQHTAAIRAQLAGRYRPATANRMLSALRGTLKAAWRLGQMSAEDYHRARDVDSVRGETLPAGRELDAGEILALVEVCKADDSPAGARDAAMIGLMYACGLRRAELVALDYKDFEVETGQIRVRAGKGRRERLVYVHGGALRALRAWQRVLIIAEGPLFVPVNKGGHLGKHRMSAQAVYNMLRKRAKEAAVREFSPHDLRRTFVSDLLARGADISTVAKLAGHRSVNTTSRYDRRPETAKKQAAALLHFPF